MIGGSLARRYARALLGIGEEDGQSRRILGEVERFAEVMAESPLLRETLTAAHVNRRDKHATLDAVLAPAEFLPSTKNFLGLLVEKGRMNILQPALAELRQMIERLEGIERVEVVVPIPLTQPQRDALRAALEAQTGREVLLEETVDPGLLGGMVVKLGSTVYDGSARTQLRSIRETLQKG
jgi:F-type H+-transporting ATPase subunit delta